MALIIRPAVSPTYPTPPKEVIGLLNNIYETEQEESLVRFFGWLDRVIRFKTIEKGNNTNITQLLNSIFAPDRVAEIVSRLRVSNNFSISQGEKNVLDYLKIKRPLVFYDTETIGLESLNNKIIEISLVKYYPDGRRESFTQLINPEIEIPESSTKINQITNEKVKDCPTFKQIAPALHAFFDNCDLGGFNILGYDNKVLEKEFQLAGIDFNLSNRANVDAMFIYHKKVPHEDGKKRNLTSAYKLYCGKDLINAHRAKADIEATIEVLIGQFEIYNDLPRDLEKLSEYCISINPEYVDKVGKFRWENEEVIFNFGKKHRNKSLRQVAEIDRGYLLWMLRGDSDFPSDVKEIVKNALMGKFPKPIEQKI